MRILIFNWRDRKHPWAGGAEVNLHELAKRWVSWGHEVALVCSSYPKADREDRIDGMKVVRLGGTYLVYVAAAWKYISNLRRQGYDVILEVVNGVPFFTPLFSRCPKVIVIHHLMRGIFFREAPPHIASIGYVLEASLPLLYRRYPIVTVSDSTKAELVRSSFPGRNVTVIPNGVTLSSSPRNRERSSHPEILYLGRLRHYKRIDLLVRAMRLVLEEVPRAKLTIAGTGESLYDLQNLVHQLELSEAIRFQGFVSEDEKAALLQAAWIMVSPSQKEGWGMTVIEAAACGVPSVAFDVPGLRDSIRDGVTGLLVKETTPEALAVAICRCLKDHNLRAELGTEARKWAQQYSWDESAHRFLQVLEQAVLKSYR